jgi:hypothetical protein
MEVLILAHTIAPRAYAVGAKFSVADVADQFAWRPTDRYWTDVEYRTPRSRVQPASDNRPRRRRAPSPVSSRIDPSRIRTPEQRKSVGRATVQTRGY